MNWMKVKDFFEFVITKLFGIKANNDLSYLTLHIKDKEAHRSMRMYRAS